MGAVRIHGKELMELQVNGQSKNIMVLRGEASTRLFRAHPLVETFNARHGTGLSVISHEVADIALTLGETWRSLPAFAADAAIAYEKPGVKLRGEIDFPARGRPRILLATGKYRGEKDIALVALGLSPADFKKDGTSSVLDIPENRLVAVPDFPASRGWFMPHAGTGVPHGEEVGIRPDARYLYRINDSSCVSLLVRHVYDFESRRVVDTLYGPSDGFGVVVEVPKADVPKIRRLIRAREKRIQRIDTPQETASPQGPSSLPHQII